MSDRKIAENSESRIRSSRKSAEQKKDRYKNKKLASFLFRMAPKIIQYARTVSIRLRKVNSYQIVLFPDSASNQQQINPDRNESLIDQYKKHHKDWYPFYFSSSNIYVDNHHLQLFSRKADLPVDFNNLGLGKVIVFGDYVGFNLPNLRSSLDLRNGYDQNNNQANGNIQKINGKNIKKLQKIFDQQEIITKNILFLGTDIGYVLAIQSRTKKYNSIKIGPNIPMRQIVIYKNYALFSYENNFHFYKIQIGKDHQIQFNSLFSAKINTGFPIKRSSFVRIQGLYYLFLIDEKGLKRITLKERKIVPIQTEESIIESDKYNPFTNMKLFHQVSMNRIVITVACTKQILFFAYSCKGNKQIIFQRMPNPKNPPSNPRIHTINCIQYFPKTQKSQFGNRRSTNRNSQSPNKLNSMQQNFRDSEQGNQDYIIVAVSFYERIYFIKMWQDQIQISKRVKFYNRIAKIQAYNEQGIMIVFHKQDQNNFIDDQQNRNSLQILDRNSKNSSLKPNEIKVQIIATLLRKLLSFKIAIHTGMIQKIEYQFKIVKELDEGQRFKGTFAMINQQLLILTETNIVRIGFNSWKDIYTKMYATQNIQLLTFLVLLKKNDSLFLKAPKSFDGLEKFFPKNANENRQILLEYYYEMNRQPPLEFIAEVLNQYPSLLLPFILQHKISNLCQNSKELLTEYWKNKDERIVEELIMAGCEHGEQMAVSRGWMRALRKMVSMGMQIHFPLLKLSSFVVQQKRILQHLDKQGNNDPDYEQKCNQCQKKINNYCLQMVDYTILALQFFLDPEEIQQLQDLKQFLLTLLTPQIINNCFKYQPEQAIKIISKLFKVEQRIALIDKLDAKQFVHIQKQFKSIIPTNFISISSCIFSYLSEVYRELTGKTSTIEQKQKFRELLIVQHAKLIGFSMQGRALGEYTTQGRLHNVKGRFQFIRPYLLQMLLILVRHNNEYLKQLIHDQVIQKQRDREQFECYIQDLLVKIWMDAKESPITNIAESSLSKEIKPISHTQIKQLILSLEQANSSNNYLLICLMYDLPASEFCVKILRKYIYCQNKLIQQRLFDWLQQTMKDQQRRALLQNQLMNHLKNIIEINKERSRRIFDLYFRNKQKDIIKKIDNDPNLQLQYLQMIICDAAQAEMQVEQYYLNLYLKLLITKRPQRVVTVLQQSRTKGKNSKIKYDLEKALNVSLELQNYPQKNRIETYLYEKLGEIQKCISSYLKILEQLFWEYIDCYQSIEDKKFKGNADGDKQNENKDENRDQYIFNQGRKVSKKVSIITQLITNKKNSQNQHKLTEIQINIQTEFRQLTELIFRQPNKKYNYLKISLDAMVTFTQMVKQQKLTNIKHYLNMCAYYFGKIIVESFEKGYLIFFKEWLKNQTKLDLNVLQKYLCEGYTKVISQQHLLNNISTIDKSVLIQNIKQTLNKIQKSTYYQSKCAVCGLFFQQYKGQVKFFSCGHIFHQICIQQDSNNQDYCWQCVYRDPIKAMINHNQMNMVAILNKYCEKKSMNRSIQKQQRAKEVMISTAKKRMNRLGIFDKKVTTIENQVQILDMKLEIAEYYEKVNKKQ